MPLENNLVIRQVTGLLTARVLPSDRQISAL